MSVHDMNADRLTCPLTLQSASRDDGVAAGSLWIGQSPPSKKDCAFRVLVPAKQKELVRRVPRFVADPDVRPRLKVGPVPHDDLAVEFNLPPIDFSPPKQSTLYDPSTAALQPSPLTKINNAKATFGARHLMYPDP